MICRFFKILIIITLSSCNQDDDRANQTQTNEFRDGMLGWYTLQAIYTDTSLDLNHDGIKNTNIFDEVTYCNMSLHLEYYDSEVTYKQSNLGSLFQVSLHVPYSEYILEQEAYSTCLFNRRHFYEIEANEETKEIEILYTYPNLQDEYRFWIEDISWENEVLYYTFRKEFYTSENTWEMVTMYMEYKFTPNYGQL